MKDFINKIKLFYADEKGGETVEWVIVVGVVVVVILAVYSSSLQTGLQARMAALTANLN
jgi:Flp pilus assembly pilin Flp